MPPMPPMPPKLGVAPMYSCMLAPSSAVRPGMRQVRRHRHHCLVSNHPAELRNPSRCCSLLDTQSMAVPTRTTGAQHTCSWHSFAHQMPKGVLPPLPHLTPSPAPPLPGTAAWSASQDMASTARLPAAVCPALTRRVPIALPTLLSASLAPLDIGRVLMEPASR